jgi:hypothetical protein
VDYYYSAGKRVSMEVLTGDDAGCSFIISYCFIHMHVL